eukprot:COSAG05_NODE_9503_length_619_cov_39.665385_1_plen_99_part_00
MALPCGGPCRRCELGRPRLVPRWGTGPTTAPCLPLHLHLLLLHLLLLVVLLHLLRLLFVLASSGWVGEGAHALVLQPQLLHPPPPFLARLYNSSPNLL